MTPGPSPDVVVIGGGIIGLATALAAAERGLTVTLVGSDEPGGASKAAAGLLAPSVGRGAIDTAARRFAVAARDRYPSYLAWVRERSGMNIPLDRSGIIELPCDARHDTPKRRGSTWLTTEDMARIEPRVAAPYGAQMHPDDGWVDTRRLLAALRKVMEQDPRVQAIAGRVTQLVFTGAEHGVTVVVGEEHVASESVVIAAGAWSSSIGGVPRHLPIRPMRGQMISYQGASVAHAIYGREGYLVPRTADDQVLVGATEEHAAFESATTASADTELRAVAAHFCPGLRDRVPLAHWAGLRPMTPDAFPIMGRDPARPQLLYACGHSRNGILLAPLTGDCLADLLTDSPSRVDVTPFRPERFSAAKWGNRQ